MRSKLLGKKTGTMCGLVSAPAVGTTWGRVAGQGPVLTGVLMSVVDVGEAMSMAPVLPPFMPDSPQPESPAHPPLPMAIHSEMLPVIEARCRIAKAPLCESY